MKKIKSFHFKVEYNGRGAVNFDDDKCHKHIQNKLYDFKTIQNDNIKCCKKVYQKIEDEDGNVTYVGIPKISANRLRRAIFEGMCACHNNGFNHDELIRCHYLLSLHSLIRGYMITVRRGTDVKQTYAKKSGFTITDAIATNSPVINFEIGTKGGEKDKDNNTLFYFENYGDVKYESSGYIDLQQIEFLSVDDIFGRMGAEANWFEGNDPIGKRILDINFGTNSGKYGYFSPVGGIHDIAYAEQGYCFNDEAVKKMVIKFLECLLGLHIKANTGYVNVDTIKIKPVYDALADRANEENGWITISNRTDLDAFIDNVINKSDFQQYYTEVSSEDCKKFREEINEYKLIAEEMKKKEQEQKKKAKEEARKKKEKNSATE